MFCKPSLLSQILHLVLNSDNHAKINVFFFYRTTKNIKKNKNNKMNKRKYVIMIKRGRMSFLCEFSYLSLSEIELIYKSHNVF